MVTHAAVVDTVLARAAVIPRITTVATKSSGVSPTRKSHQNRPNAFSQRTGRAPRRRAG